MIHARIASIPDREESLRKTVASIRPYVDTVFVALNGYDHVPEFLSAGEYELLDNSLGDAAKFLHVEDLQGYIFTLDDDLVYPREYCQDMIITIEKHNSPITLHGKVFGKRPVVNYFKSFTENYPCLADVLQDVQVDVGGTGVMAWRSDMLQISIEDFPVRNMADVWFAKLCHEQGMPIMCMAHSFDYLTYMPQETTLWRSSSRQPGTETRIINSFLR